MSESGSIEQAEIRPAQQFFVASPGMSTIEAQQKANQEGVFVLRHDVDTSLLYVPYAVYQSLQDALPDTMPIKLWSNDLLGYNVNALRSHIPEDATSCKISDANCPPRDNATDNKAVWHSCSADNGG
jgi:hypothetical protein